MHTIALFLFLPIKYQTTDEYFITKYIMNNKLKGYKQCTILTMLKNTGSISAKRLLVMCSCSYAKTKVKQGTITYSFAINFHLMLLTVEVFLIKYVQNKWLSSCVSITELKYINITILHISYLVCSINHILWNTAHIWNTFF